jgi:hypothetical protein
MNEKEIRAKYETLQNDVRVSEELKHRTLAQAREAEKAGAVSEAAAHPTSAAVSTAVNRRARSQRPRGIWPRIGAVAAACLMMAIVGLGISALSTGTTSPNGGETPSADVKSTPALPLDFTIQAYASSTDQVFSPNQNGVLFFESEMLGRGFVPGDTESLKEWGAYTWSTFSIQGEGITRMQIETSKGELYRYTPLQMTGDEDPEFIQAARAWKPTHGALLGEYDSVNVRVPLNYGEIKNSGVSEDEMRARLYSAETTWKIDLMKRLGSTADITVDAADNQNYLFGLWTNEGTIGFNPFNAILDSFNGETLTVTVWFEDGHQSAMTIELDAVDVKCKLNYADDDGPYGPTLLGFEFTDEVVDQENMTEQQLEEFYAANEGYILMHTLRGTIIETHSTAE